MRAEDLLKAVRAVADYQFGAGVGLRLFPDGCVVEASKRTRRPRYVYLDGALLATLRSMDGLLALSIEGARRLSEIVPRPRFRVVVHGRAVPRVLEGRNVLAGWVKDVDELLMPGEEVLVEDGEGGLLAVGRAAVSGATIRELERGVVVKVRQAVKLNRAEAEVGRG